MIFTNHSTPTYFITFSGNFFELQSEHHTRECPYCQKHLKYKNLRRHIQGVHLKMKPFKCEYCDARFSQKINRANHIKSVHFGEKPYICECCDARFSRKRDKVNHVRRIHAEQQQPDLNDEPMSKDDSTNCHLTV